MNFLTVHHTRRSNWAGKATGAPSAVCTILTWNTVKARGPLRPGLPLWPRRSNQFFGNPYRWTIWYSSDNWSKNWRIRSALPCLEGCLPKQVLFLQLPQSNAQYDQQLCWLVCINEKTQLQHAPLFKVCESMKKKDEGVTGAIFASIAATVRSVYPPRRIAARHGNVWRFWRTLNGTPIYTVHSNQLEDGDNSEAIRSRILDHFGPRVLFIAESLTDSCSWSRGETFVVAAQGGVRRTPSRQHRQGS